MLIETFMLEKLYFHFSFQHPGWSSLYKWANTKKCRTLPVLNVICYATSESGALFLAENVITCTQLLRRWKHCISDRILSVSPPTYSIMRLCLVLEEEFSYDVIVKPGHPRFQCYLHKVVPRIRWKFAAVLCRMSQLRHVFRQVSLLRWWNL